MEKKLIRVCDSSLREIAVDANLTDDEIITLVKNKGINLNSTIEKIVWTEIDEKHKIINGQKFVKIGIIPSKLKI